MPPHRPDPDAARIRQHAELLQTDPQRYTELVRDIAAYGIYLLDADGKVRSWNQGAHQITGLEARDVVGLPYDRLYLPENRRDGTAQKTIDFARQHRHYRGDQARRRADGTAFIAEVTLDLIRARDGRLVGFVEIVQDITERKEREEALYNQATRDALTGAFNRGHFTALAEQEIERSRRFGEPLSAAMLDIDHFKNVNDTYGHDVGDEAIIALARLTGGFIRKIDTLGRLGGEEFAVLFPRAEKQPAYEMCNRLRLKIAENRIPLPPDKDQSHLAYTVSIGVASLRPQTADLKELLRNADAALYQSKHEGRNRVTQWWE